MELREPIEEINQKLKDEFGLAFNGQPNFRVVFSDDQFEKRWTSFSDEGFELLHPEVRELPKYRQYIRGKYILERLVPAGPETDLIEKISYEPARVFEDKNGNYLPPRYDICKLVILAIFSQIEGAGVYTKYKDKNETPEEYKLRIQEMQDKLFGDETAVGDALTHGWGVSMAGLDSKNPKLTH